MSTIGEQLKKAREDRKLTIKQVVQVIRVRAHYLIAMEAEDFSAMPSAAQSRGFLRLYGEFLGLDADSLINQLKNNSSPANSAEPVVLAPVITPAPSAPIPEPEAIPAPPAVYHFPQIENPGPQVEKKASARSNEIFVEIGSILQTRRELISLTLDEIERHTHVRKQNLELIELGEFDQLASPVQLRGTLSAYANFLDLDTEALLLRYADGIQSRRIERQGSELPKSSMQKARAELPIWLRRFISPDLVFGGSMILILLALSIWGAQRIFSGNSNIQNNPTQGPSISDVLLASPAAAETSLEGNPTSILLDAGTVFPTQEPTLNNPIESPVATTSSAVQVTVVILDRTFLRVTVDGKVEQEGRVSPGAALTFDGNNQIEILTGSGNAVQIIFNQNDLGRMGNFGEVVNRIYTINGIETPTLTPSPTPTITPVPSRTRKPSLTPPPTATKRPTSTLRPVSTSTP